MDALATARGLRYEIVFVNDGSRDRSAAILSDQFRARPDVTRVVLFNANYGQHAAIMAGFERVRGRIIVTLDADLQNPPEEIGKLIDAMQAGYDYVGTIRQARKDSAWRKAASRAMNRMRERITHITMTDQGCMLRAYDRRIVETINQCREINTFIPALAYTFANKPVEIEVAHAERAAGESKYSLYSLIRLNFDLVTGFSVVPLQAFSLFGAMLSAASAVLVLVAGAATDLRRARGGGPVHAVRHRLLPDRRDAARHRPARRVHRPHLRGSARATALDRAGRARTRRRRRRRSASMRQRGRRRSSSRITTSASAAC